MLKVRNKETGEIFTVQKYTLSGGEEATENVWCVGWYGRHVIGNDCEGVVERDFTVDELRQINFACMAAVSSPEASIISIYNIDKIKSKVRELIITITDETLQ